MMAFATRVPPGEKKQNFPEELILLQIYILRITFLAKSRVRALYTYYSQMEAVSAPQ